MGEALVLQEYAPLIGVLYSISFLRGDVEIHSRRFTLPPNNSMQRTALRAAADADRWAK